jgi:hypothetical protein
MKQDEDFSEFDEKVENIDDNSGIDIDSNDISSNDLPKVSAVGVSKHIRDRIAEEASDDTDEDYDFDFSIYSARGEDDYGNINDVPEDALMKDVPAVKTVRSRWSNFGTELEKMAQLNALSTKYAILVESRTQDINILRKFIGILNEIWVLMRFIFGGAMQGKVLTIKARCGQLLDDAQSEGGYIPPKVHNNLLYYRDVVYSLRQYANLGLELETRTRGYTQRAEKQIVS